MSEIEKVSSFEYQVWRIKRWFFMNAVPVLLFAGLLLSVWAVFIGIGDQCKGGAVGRYDVSLYVSLRLTPCHHEKSVSLYATKR